MGNALNKEKQIEEMARICCNLCEYERSGKCTVVNSCGIGMCYMATHTAKRLYNEGYRKHVEGETYFEILEQEIEEALRSNYQARADRIEQGGYDEFISFIDGKIIALRGIQEFVSSLKIKYKGENKDEMDTE